MLYELNEILQCGLCDEPLSEDFDNEIRALEDEDGDIAFIVLCIDCVLAVDDELDEPHEDDPEVSTYGYAEFRPDGIVGASGFRRGDDVARFWSRIDTGQTEIVPQPYSLADMRGIDTPCWIYTGKVNNLGYGDFWSDDSIVGAHRFGYEAQGGVLDPELVVDHTCENRSCIRLEHLEQVTNKENLDRGIQSAARRREALVLA